MQTFLFFRSSIEKLSTIGHPEGHLLKESLNLVGVVSVISA